MNKMERSWRSLDGCLKTLIVFNNNLHYYIMSSVSSLAISNSIIASSGKMVPASTVGNYIYPRYYSGTGDTAVNNNRKKKNQSCLHGANHHFTGIFHDF